MKKNKMKKYILTKSFGGFELNEEGKVIVDERKKLLFKESEGFKEIEDVLLYCLTYLGVERENIKVEVK